MAERRGELVASGTIAGTGANHNAQNTEITAASPNAESSMYNVRITNLIAESLVVTLSDAQRNSAGTIIYCYKTSFPVAASVGLSVNVQGWLLTDGRLTIDPDEVGANAVDWFVYRA